MRDTNHTLEGKRAAFIVADGFEQVELTGPKHALQTAGVDVDIISTAAGSVRGFNHLDPADSFKVDRTIGDIAPDSYDAVVLPGGLFSPDQLRTNESVHRFVRTMFSAGKPVAAICHGPWILINSRILNGRRVTSIGSIRLDLENAGAIWSNEPVVRDHRLITSRNPGDIDAFSQAILEEMRLVGDSGIAFSRLNKLIEDIGVAMLTTVEPDGSLRSRPMMTQSIEGPGEVLFLTSADSPKADEIRVHDQVNVSYAKPTENRYVSLTGSAELSFDRDKIDEFWKPEYKLYFPNGPQDPSLAILRVYVEKAEFWDAPRGMMATLYHTVKALTGRRSQRDPSEHQRLVLSHD